MVTEVILKGSGKRGFVFQNSSMTFALGETKKPPTDYQ